MLKRLPIRTVCPKPAAAELNDVLVVRVGVVGVGVELEDFGLVGSMIVMDERVL